MEVEKKVKPSDMDSDLENELKKDVCYAPLSYHSECNTITNAHSISKSKHLKLIANKQGYVYGLKISSGIIHANNGKIIRPAYKPIEPEQDYVSIDERF